MHARYIAVPEGAWKPHYDTPVEAMDSLGHDAPTVVYVYKVVGRVTINRKVEKDLYLFGDDE